MTDKRVSTTPATDDEIAKKGLARICRAGDDREAVERAALRILVEKYGNSAVNAVDTNVQGESAPSAPTIESVEALADPETQALAKYEQQFSWLQADNKPEWDVVKGRLTADGNKKLKLAMDLESTVIFGVDASGNVLFSDGGEEVPESTKGKNYFNTMTAIKDKYELFDKVLMRQWETATGNHFVRNSWSWLKSENLLPLGARFAYFYSDYGKVDVAGIDLPKHGRPYRGARRLLRV